MITRTCAQCQQPYETYPSVKLTYCSHACASRAKQRGQAIRCEQCGTEAWSPPSQIRRFCSKGCAATARNLTAANPAYGRDISGERNPMHGHGLSGPANGMYGKRKAAAPRWTGGKKIRRDGYTFVVAPDGYPNPSYVKPSGTAYVLEHRLVVERRIGRYLTAEEVVHHIDRDPANNDDGNLRLFATQAEHIRVGHGGVSA